MVAYMRVVEQMTRKYGHWKEKKTEWTQGHVQNMIDAIQGEFRKRFMDRTNRARETSWSTVYCRMSRLGALKEAREFLQGTT